MTPRVGAQKEVKRPPTQGYCIRRYSYSYYHGRSLLSSTFLFCLCRSHFISPKGVRSLEPHRRGRGKELYISLYILEISCDSRIADHVALQLVPTAGATSFAEWVFA